MFLFVFPSFFRWRKQLEWGFIIETPFCLPADTYSDVINIGLPSLRGEGEGRGQNIYETNNNIINVIAYVLYGI